MVNIITDTDFSYPYLPVVTDDATLSRIDNIITEYQPKILIDILGNLEYENLYNDYGSNPTPTNPIWVDFINGTTWQEIVNNIVVTINYKGIKPILTRLIYYYYIMSVQTLKMESGEGRGVFQNANQINPDDLIRFSYNEAISLIGYDWPNNINCNSLEKYRGTVFNYLYNNKSSFPNWEFTQLKGINAMGI